MIQDQKFVTAKTIMDRVARVHKHKVNEFHENSFVEWCAECEIEYVCDTESKVLYKAYEIKVENLQALLPCNLHRILDVCASNDMLDRIEFYNNGAYIEFDDDASFSSDSFGNDVVYISFYGIKLDQDTGFPVIKRTNLQVCEAFCVKKIYTEDYMLNKIDANRWYELIVEFENQLGACKGGFKDVSRNDMEWHSRIIGNIVNKIGFVPRYQLD